MEYTGHSSAREGRREEANNGFKERIADNGFWERIERIESNEWAAKSTARDGIIQEVRPDVQVLGVEISQP